MRIDKYIADLRSRNIIVTVHDGQLAINDSEDELTPEIIDELKAKKTEILNFFNAVQKQKTFEAIPKAVERTYYPLSSTQIRMHFLHQFDPLSTVYNTPMAYEFLGKLDVDKLELSIQALVNRHESLRTVFKVIDGDPVQEILQGKDFKVSHQKSSRDHLDTFFRDFIKPFDLSSEYPIRVCLLKVCSDEHFLLIDIHHIVSDLGSMNILVNDLTSYYNDITLPALDIQYKDYAVWQQSPAQQKVLDLHKDFWLSEFAEESYPLEIPTSFERPLNKTFEGSSLRFVLDEEMTRGLSALCNNLETTLFMNLFAIYTILLSKLSNTDDIVIGTPVSGRQHHDLEGVMGMFVNTLPIRNQVINDSSVEDFMLSIKDKVLESLNHQFYQYESLIEDLNIPRDTSRNPLFDFMFAFQQAEISEYETTDLSIKNYSSEVTTSKFDLTLSCTQQGNQIYCNFDYCTGIFDVDTIQSFANYFKHLVFQIVKSSNTKIKDLSLLKKSAQEQLLSQCNNTSKSYNSEVTIHHLFERQVAKTPDAEAISFKGNSLSYKELNDRSNQLAYLLRSKGVEANTVIGIMQHRSFDMIISILAILKSGGAYLPIDPDYPLDRVEKMVIDSNMWLLLTNLKLTDTISEQVECLDLGEVDYQETEIDNLNDINRSSDLLYVIYTSGSTGVPKGVMVNHRNLVNLMDYHFNGTNIDTSSVLQFTTLTFDPSFIEIFSALLTGGKLHLVDEVVARDFSKLLRHIEIHEIRTIFMPSSVLNQMFNSKEYLDEVPTTLRNIVTAGEQVIVGDLFKKYLEYHEVYLHNHYGPAETHVVTGCTIDPYTSIPSMPSIGKPIQNTQIYILDSGMQQQPVNVAGELYIGGDQLGDGYLLNPELTDERFIDNPFQSGERLYRTGDLAKWSSNGNIEFLGRVDDQIKLHGVRIEPGEISSHLNSMEGIAESVAIVCEIREEKSLVAYYVSKEPITASTFRAYLVDRLPFSMIPNYFVHLSEMPLTATGKLYRKALPIPEIKKELDYIAATNPTEEKLVTMWSEILNLDKDQISVNRSFFELGGQSLKAVTLVNSIYKEFSVEISLRKVFVKQTIDEIANFIITVKQLDEESNDNQEKIEITI